MFQNPTTLFISMEFCRMLNHSLYSSKIVSLLLYTYFFAYFDDYHIPYQAYQLLEI